MRLACSLFSASAIVLFRVSALSGGTGPICFCQQPPKTLKFKPLVTHAQEPPPPPSSSGVPSLSAKRGDPRARPPPPPPTARAAASGSRSPRRPRPDACGGGGGGTYAGSSAGAGVKMGDGAWTRPRQGSGAGVRGAGGDGGEDANVDVCFRSLQVKFRSCGRGHCRGRGGAWGSGAPARLAEWFAVSFSWGGTYRVFSIWSFRAPGWGTSA